MGLTLFTPLLFMLGAVIGSFLNVVLYRLHTIRTLSGRSHCLSCGHALSWYELVPLVSYFIQRGRCRACHSRVTARYAFVEGLTGILFVCVGYAYVNPVAIIIGLIVMSTLVLIVTYDMLHTIIPDELVVVISIAVLALAFFDTQTVTLIPSLNLFIESISSALSGAIVASGFFGGLWVVSRGRWIGLGDAKLAIPLGFAVGWPGALSLVVFGFWIGAVISLLILFGKRVLSTELLRGKLGLGIGGSALTMKSEVPFAPFLVASFILVQFFGADIFTFTAAFIPAL